MKPVSFTIDNGSAVFDGMLRSDTELFMPIPTSALKSMTVYFLAGYIFIIKPKPLAGNFQCVQIDRKNDGLLLRLKRMSR